MASVDARGISVRELAEALRSVDSRAVLVPPRILRRIVRGVLGLDRLMGQIPHRGGFAAPSAGALEYADVARSSSWSPVGPSPSG